MRSIVLLPPASAPAASNISSRTTCFPAATPSDHGQTGWMLLVCRAIPELWVSKGGSLLTSCLMFFEFGFVWCPPLSFVVRPSLSSQFGFRLCLCFLAFCVLLFIERNGMVCMYLMNGYKRVSLYQGVTYTIYFMPAKLGYNQFRRSAHQGQSPKRSKVKLFFTLRLHFAFPPYPPPLLSIPSFSTLLVLPLCLTLPSWHNCIALHQSSANLHRLPPTSLV